MIDPATLSFQALMLTGFALGARHALDADHLAVVDAAARRSAVSRPWHARMAGVSFAAGHVLVVTGIAFAGCLFLSRQVAPPDWLALTGVAISATTLILLGMMNLRAVRRHAGTGPVPVRGWRSRLVPPADRSLMIVLTGALFAISFDTVAIALGLGVAGKLLGGWPWALMGCAGFAAGMVLVGTANGALTVHLLRSADARAAMVSRAVTGGIGLANLGLGLLGMAALLLPRLDQWREAHGLAASAAVVALSAGTFAFAALLHALRAKGGRAGPSLAAR